MGHDTAILGASGYAGGELVRLVAEHPSLELAYLGAHSKAGADVDAVHPQLGISMELGTIDPGDVPDVDVAFLALPHGASHAAGLALADRGIKVVDLGSDFRADADWAYGLPELFGERIAGGNRTAAPGCYPTSAVLALAPLVGAGLVAATGIVVDSMSGVTGAGRGVRENLTFGAVAEGVRAYAVGGHRHQPEMEMAIGAATGTEPQLLFTPHLVPMQRGLLSTCYARLTADADPSALAPTLEKAYAASPFVSVIDEPPQTRWTVGSNRCLLSVAVDERSGTAIVLSALDNLLKGAAGQAVQCANLMLGLDEAAGLPLAGLLP